MPREPFEFEEITPDYEARPYWLEKAGKEPESEADYLARIEAYNAKRRTARAKEVERVRLQNQLLYQTGHRCVVESCRGVIYHKFKHMTTRSRFDRADIPIGPGQDNYGEDRLPDDLVAKPKEHEAYYCSICGLTYHELTKKTRGLMEGELDEIPVMSTE